MARGGKRHRGQRPHTPHNYDVAWARTELEVVNAKLLNRRQPPRTAAEHLAWLSSNGAPRLEREAFAKLLTAEDPTTVIVIGDDL
jgi:hypothetical protein